ncbi:MAG TPA: RcpC/CpaB family pilus assembly protein, partial [Acidimicrobiales bacterium]
WGESQPVLVAAHDIDAGAAMGPSDVRLEERPRSSTPQGALTELPDGQVLRSAVYEGEVLVGERLAPVGVHGLAATLPTGTRAVAIPVEPGLAPPLQVGDVVDVLVALAPESAGSGPPGFVLAPSVLVVDVGEHAVAVAVERDDAPRVAVALGRGAVTLALVGA